jgi:ABC-2 type transport system permease protein
VSLALVLHQARYDLRAFVRNKQSRYFTFVLPVVLLVVFVGMFGDRTVGPDNVKSSAYYVPGLCALAIVAASFVNLVISITAQRESGILKRRRATPVPASVLIAGRTLTAVTVSLVTLAILLAFGDIAYGVHVSAGAIPALVLIAVSGSATFCVLAYAASTQIRSADAAQPLVQAIMVPLYFVSGVFVPSVELPHTLRRAGEIFPLERIADGLHHAYQGGGIVWGDLAVLALWAGAGIVVALWRFSWTPAVTSS